jgi:uncharacterized protein with HEPN domain
MSRHDDFVLLGHMVEHGKEALELMGTQTRQEFAGNRLLFLAISRLIGIVGEAAAKTSPGMRTKLPGLPWPEIVGFRNRLVHGYADLNVGILWDTVKCDFPPMIEILERFLTDPESA